MPKDAKGHGSNPRGTSLHKPLPDHAYHGKTDAELHYIIKDAGEAGKNAQAMGKLEHKYSDQVNDAHTVLGYRKRLSDHEAQATLRQGSGAKSDQVATHNAQGHAWGSPEALADFKRQYGPHKGFASGKREIARLKRQGK